MTAGAASALVLRRLITVRRLITGLARRSTMVMCSKSNPNNVSAREDIPHAQYQYSHFSPPLPTQKTLAQGFSHHQWPLRLWYYFIHTQPGALPYLESTMVVVIQANVLAVFHPQAHAFASSLHAVQCTHCVLPHAEVKHTLPYNRQDKQPPACLF